MRKFLVPLQALLALLLCSGMAWIVFVVSAINPAPPTGMDLQARNTQDLSFASMNSTAIALAKQMVVGLMPSPAATFYLPVTGADTATVVPLVTLRALPTAVSTSTTLSLLSGLIPPTATRERPGQVVPSSTAARVPTMTLRPPTTTAVWTPGHTESPSFTPIAMASKPTSTRIAVTSTSIAHPTSTPKTVPTNTPAATTPVAVNTNTAKPTNTPGPISTPKPTKTPKHHSTGTPVPPPQIPPTHYP